MLIAVEYTFTRSGAGMRCRSRAIRPASAQLNRSGAPIYDQIYSQIKDAILYGQVAEGEALPSIRALAKDLRISVITTKRAYDELENEGFIYTLPGKGCFVAERSTELLREENLKKIESHMQEIRRLANACRLTEQELDDMWRLQKEEAE